MLTAPWHERDAQSLVERLGVPVYTPLPDTAHDLMDTYGVTAEQAGDGSPDVVWLNGGPTDRAALERALSPPRPQAARHPSSTTEAERRMVFPSGSSTIAKRSFGVTLYGAQCPT